MKLSKDDRTKFANALGRLVEAHSLVEDVVVVIRTGQKPAHRVSESYLVNLQAVIGATREAIELLTKMVDPYIEEPQNLLMEAAIAAGEEAKMSVINNFIESSMGPITVLDEIVDAVDDADDRLSSARNRVWCDLDDGLIHLEITYSNGSEVKGYFKPDEVEKAHDFLVKHNAGAGLLSSSCTWPEEYGLPDDFNIDDWLEKARRG